VVAEPYLNSPSAPIRLDLFRPDGALVDHLQLPTGSEVLAAAGDRIFFQSENVLKALHSNGSVETLLASFSESRLIVNPEGTRWIWRTYQAGGDTVHSQVFLGGDNLSPRVIEDSTERQRVLEPYSWTAQGVFVEHSPMGIGGYIPFAPAFGPVDRLDPTTWIVSADPRTSACSFSDRAADGTIACFTQTQDSRQLTLVRLDGGKQTIQLAKPIFNLSGDAFFNPTASRLTVVGAVGTPPAEQFTTELASSTDGSLTPAAEAGVRIAMGPQSWLPDGSLVLWRPQGAAGGSPGLYVAPSTGATTFIPVSGTPVGYLG
jgi:hypothetical protein